ncbi:MAG: 50S ribosomal protein L40e [Candidatus Helarchaeota archaeon]
MPITDPVKKAIAVRSLLFYKICRKCGATNSQASIKCRKCHTKNLRWKKREITK